MIETAEDSSSPIECGDHSSQQDYSVVIVLGGAFLSFTRNTCRKMGKFPYSCQLLCADFCYMVW